MVTSCHNCSPNKGPFLLVTSYSLSRTVETLVDSVLSDCAPFLLFPPLIDAIRSVVAGLSRVGRVCEQQVRFSQWAARVLTHTHKSLVIHTVYGREREQWREKGSKTEKKRDMAHGTCSPVASKNLRTYCIVREWAHEQCAISFVMMVTKSDLVFVFVHHVYPRVITFLFCCRGDFFPSFLLFTILTTHILIIFIFITQSVLHTQSLIALYNGKTLWHSDGP